MIFLGIVIIIAIAVWVWLKIYTGYSVPCDIDSVKQIIEDADEDFEYGYTVNVIAHPPFHNIIIFYHVQVTSTVLGLLDKYKDQDIQCYIRHNMNGKGYEFLGFDLSRCK